MPDDVLTFEQLREIQKKEQQEDTLSPLDREFFSNAEKYLGRKKRLGDYHSEKEYREAKHIIEDIVDSRQKKIIRLAFLSTKADITVQNLLPEEEHLFDKVQESIKDHRERIEEDVFKEAITAEETSIEEPVTSGETESEDEEETAEGSGEPASEGEAGQETEDRSESEEPEDDGDELVFGDDDGSDTDEETPEEDDGDDDSPDVPDGKERVRVLDDVPEFMGVDLESYGPFEEGDVVTVPEDNADVLVEQGNADVLD